MEQPAQPLTFAIKAQYVRDLSLENPNAPNSLRAPKERPQVRTEIELEIAGVGEDHYETLIKLGLRVATDEQTLLLIELKYGAIVQATGFAPPQLDALLRVDVPFIIFPFVRQIVADASLNAGFSPIMLEPIDFRTIYETRRMEAQHMAQA